jgi:hypothetical protein
LPRITARVSLNEYSRISVCLCPKDIEKIKTDKTYSARIHMVVPALEKDTYPFKPKEEGEDVLGQEYTYLSVIGALMYLTNNTRPDIVSLERH